MTAKIIDGMAVAGHVRQDCRIRWLEIKRNGWRCVMGEGMVEEVLFQRYY